MGCCTSQGTSGKSTRKSSRMESVFFLFVEVEDKEAPYRVLNCFWVLKKAPASGGGEGAAAGADGEKPRLQTLEEIQ